MEYINNNGTQVSTRANKAYVAKIELKNNTYYVTDRPDITLDSETYLNVVRFWGDVGFYSNTEMGDFQIGTIDIELINGEKFLDDGYVFSPTDVWNNYTCTVRLYTDGDVEFESCDPIIKGKIKNYNINDNTISFSVEQIDDRDDILLPAIVCEDQSELSDAEAAATPVSFPQFDTIVFSTGDASIFKAGELVLLTFDTYYPEVAGEPYSYSRIKSIDDTNTTVVLCENFEFIFRIISVEKAFRYIPKKFIGSTLPIQIGSLTNEDDGRFGKTITISEKVGRKQILADYLTLNYIDHIGVWDDGSRRFFEATKNDHQTSILRTNTLPNASSLVCESVGIFSQGDYIVITDGTNSESVRITTITNFGLTKSEYSDGCGKLNFSPNLVNGYNVGLSTISLTLGEYSVYNNNLIRFDRVNSITLLNSISGSDSISELNFSNVDIRKIPYYDEDNKMVRDNKTILSQAILAVGTELLLVVERPDYTGLSVYVERGYNNTDISYHAPGSDVIIAETFGSKNLLSFRARFDAVSACNFNYQKTAYNNLEPILPYVSDYPNADGYIASALSKMFDGDSTTYYEYKFKTTTSPMAAADRVYTHQSMNIVFEHINLDATVFKVAPALRSTITASGDWGTISIPGEIGAVGAFIFMNNGEENIRYDTKFGSMTKIGLCMYFEGITEADGTYTHTTTSYSPYNGEGMTTFSDDSNSDFDFDMTELKSLNKPPRMYLMNFTECLTPSGFNSTNGELIWNFKIYQLGLWIDFFVDYTKETIVAPLQGRKTTSTVATITGAVEGDICTHPIDVCALLLTQELGYEVDDFGDGWTEKDNSGGIAWTVRTAPNNNWLQAVTYGNGLFVAVSIDGSLNNAITSPDGITWTARTTPNNNSWHGVTYGNGLFVAVSINGNLDRAMTSPDGITWTARTTPNNNWWRAVTYGNGLFVAVGSTGAFNKAMTSPDGITWTARTTPGVDQQWYGVTYGNGMFVAVGSLGGLNGVMTSPDAITWTLRTTPNYGTWNDVTYGNDLFVAVGSLGATSKAMTSPDGITWTARTTPGSATWNGVTYGNGFYVAVGTTGKVMTSPDAITWTLRTTPNVDSWYGVTYGNDLFVAVSYSGDTECIITSPIELDDTTCVMSYGIDDKRKRGFDFVSEIANHHNYLITKTYNDKLDIINIYNIYSSTDTGNKIEIEEILFLDDSGQRRISIFQTGNDLIFNDIIVKYNRNNSTNEYQSVYILPDTFTLAKSGITLKQARDDYYGGKKRTLEIESPYIYSETYAQELAETKANEFAEVHLYIEQFIDYDHYSEKNSLTSQYKIGDIIYNNGTSNGVTFNSSRKFFIKDVTILDNGREIKLCLKSADPVSEF